ncbi:hypothetical protein BOTBODRAFT_174851 [Botryobasidium botryosum FD-172 SS1]|uniref:C2H2-type domain-containing protein n=1 Tax=Botryobasidium botryosum (strain FD-172 SS1) TaxID=930990 RepID=A0A067MRA4_BOTB1|nr:hypothetical protein BOTBODRAFT_174851 [Botryobasidium botryosum FD-172 SS1]
MPETIDLTADTDSTPSSRAGSEPPLSDAALLAHLNAAISTVPEVRLREILTNVVGRVPAFARALFSELVTTVPDEPDQESDSEYVPRWEICVNCDKEYDAGEEREEGECVYHSGSLQVEYDRFEDWDERCHGPMDSSANRRDYPENFSWTCCGEDGTDEGCEEDEHEPGGMLKKRQRRR